MSQGSKFFITLCVIAGLVLGWFFLRQKFDIKPRMSNSSKENPVAPPQRVTKKYSNEKYGFSFEYPDGYVLKEVSPEQIVIGRQGVKTFTPIADIQIIKSSPEIELQTFEEFVIDQARVACAVENPETSFACTRIDDVVKIKGFTSDAKVSGQVFYLKGEEKDAVSGSTRSLRRGPFYTFNTSQNTPNTMSFLMIYNPVELSPNEADLPFLEIIARSVAIAKVPLR